jgi:GMC oxidoreductase
VTEVDIHTGCVFSFMNLSKLGYKLTLPRFAHSTLCALARCSPKIEVVVGAKLRVYGASKLCVVDASVFPVELSAHEIDDHGARAKLTVLSKRLLRSLLPTIAHHPARIRTIATTATAT